MANDVDAYWQPTAQAFPARSGSSFPAATGQAVSFPIDGDGVSDFTLMWHRYGGRSEKTSEHDTDISGTYPDRLHPLRLLQYLRRQSLDQPFLIRLNRRQPLLFQPNQYNLHPPRPFYKRRQCCLCRLPLIPSPGHH